MSQYKIAVIVGSLRKDSLNRKLANALAKLAPSEFFFKHLDIGELPLYNQDNDNDQPSVVKSLKDDVKTAQGLLFVTPEYNRSMPGVLKNAIDHGSRPYGQSCWAGKAGAIVGVSPGQIGTALAQQDLRAVLSHLNVAVLRQPEAFTQATETLFDSSGNIGEASKKFFQGWMDQYVAWIKKHAG